MNEDSPTAFLSSKSLRKARKKFLDENVNDFSVTLERQLNPQEFLDLDRLILEEKESKGIVDISNDSSPYIPLAEKYVYHPGETVHGEIILDLFKDIPAVKVQVTFKGKIIQTYIVVKHKTSHTVRLNDELDVGVQYCSTVWQASEEKRFAATRCLGMELGHHRFSFQHVIPSGIIGTVFYESKHKSDRRSAWTRFYYQAILTLENGLTITSEKPVAIQRELMFSPELGVPRNTSQSREITQQFGSCYGGEFSADAKFNPGFFIADGEQVVIDLYINNQTKKKLRKIKCLLYQKAGFYIPHGKDYLLEKIVSEKKFHPNIKPNMSLTISGIRLPVPRGLEPTLHENTPLTRQFSISYFIRLEFYTSRIGSCDACCELNDIIIGTCLENQTDISSPSPQSCVDEETLVGHHAMVMSARQLVVNAAFQRATSGSCADISGINYNTDDEEDDDDWWR